MTNSKEQSFRKIYEEEADALFRFILMRCSDRELAKELVQETFARLWQAEISGKVILNSRAFIYKVARNQVIDWYRKKKPISLDKVDDDGNTLDIPDERMLGMAEISSDARRAVALIEKLPAEYREVIYLRFFEDLLPQEISEILGVNANVVSIKITRGMDTLRKLMRIEKDE